MIDISVIIPCFNRRSTIGTAIDSVLAQHFDGTYEIIVSDDGSNDGSIAFVREQYGSKVLVLEKPVSCKDQGVSGARNRGIAKAMGKYLCFLDSDDYYLPDFFETMYNELNCNEDLGYVFCAVNQQVKNNGRIITARWTKPKMSILDRKYHVLSSAHCIWTGCIMLKKECIDVIGVFNQNLLIGEDTDMWLRLSEEFNGRFINKVCSVYCIEGFTENQLTQGHSVDKTKYSTLVLQESADRLKKKKKFDTIRLLLIRRTLLMFKLPQHDGIIFKVFRQLVVHVYLAFVMPKAFIRYIYLRLNY